MAEKKQSEKVESDPDATRVVRPEEQRKLLDDARPVTDEEIRALRDAAAGRGPEQRELYNLCCVALGGRTDARERIEALIRTARQRVDGGPRPAHAHNTRIQMFGRCGVCDGTESEHVEQLEALDEQLAAASSRAMATLAGLNAEQVRPAANTPLVTAVQEFIAAHAPNHDELRARAEVAADELLQELSWARVEPGDPAPIAGVFLAAASLREALVGMFVAGAAGAVDVAELQRRRNRGGGRK